MLDVNEFDSMQIGLASPEKIHSWSHGEVTKPETINYRTLKPEKDGLFCERIFGPNKDWECHCGKYKRIRNKGVVCDKCGVEVTRAKVRRERMGHIDLATPVSHIWYFKGIPSRMGLILDISPRHLERVLYFVSYIVIDPKDTGLKKMQLLTETEYREAVETYGYRSFDARMGAEAIQHLLQELDLDALDAELKDEAANGTGARRAKAIRRLEVVRAFKTSGNKPEWMIMDCIPVIPPELRPMVQLDGGRFATSDLNDLYRRVINRNNRLKRLMELQAPEIIVRNEKRMLQEAVDALIDNGRRGRPVTGPGNRPLKSLSDLLKGKQGRFRQNLLGKRVDYSGRSVIVVGPELKMHQCGLPKEMALELFKPFVMKELVSRGLANNIKNAKKKVEKVAPEVWDVLEDVIHQHPVLLNRAPTLHRLGIQAFEPILWEGRAIKLHPLVCAAYNADFDGDQMACHLPLSVEAQEEARTLMLSVNNILSTKDGKPVAVPSQDMVLGAYYLTIDREEAYRDEAGRPLRKVPATEYIMRNEEEREGVTPIPVFADYDEVMLAYSQYRFANSDRYTAREDDPFKLRLQDYIFVRIMHEGERRLVLTTPGRLIFNRKLPEELRYYKQDENGVWNLGILMDKKALAKLIDNCFRMFGMARTAELLDEVKALGFYCARKAGMTVSIDDIHVPEAKSEIISEAEQHVDKIDELFRSGFISDDERYRQTVQAWRDATDKVTEVMLAGFDKFNPLTMMAQSGARGNTQQIRQLAGMRGLMADPSGRIIDLPIKQNFREGLSVLDYFTSSHGARKGLADTALRTADSGYLTRRLVDVAQDVIVREEDCDIVRYDLAKERELRLADTAEAAAQRARFDSEILGATLVETLEIAGREYPADTEITADLRDQLLAGDLATIAVRRNEVQGIQVEAIKEGNGVIEPLRDRLAGRVAAEDIYASDGKTLLVGRNEEIDEAKAAEIERHHETVAIRSPLTCRCRYGVCKKCYGRNLGTGREVEVGEAVGIIAAQSIGEPGTQLTMRTFHTGGVASDEDITQGLPRVEELFEARKPKRFAIIADIGGLVKIEDDEDHADIKRVVITDGGESWTKTIPYNMKIVVADGDTVKKGARLTDGSINPHDILRVLGVRDTQRYIVYEVQKVYKSQGVEINDKHIEVIVRQMLHKIKIENSGDAHLLPGDTVEANILDDINRGLVAAGKEEAQGKYVLLGITKAALATDSFLSAASFQETTRVLTEAAIKGKIDPLLGLKENVIIGKLIPAGTGMTGYRSVEVDHLDPATRPQPPQSEKVPGRTELDLDAEFGEPAAVTDTAEPTEPPAENLSGAAEDTAAATAQTE
ncbi:MAG: DNA-directed RNA polymerase subunit beta' [Veillonellaceae bacterium]|nr:DNA-directed RNA polymerase subunit beta' [Veillonellaceae bacterium]